ncbi:THO complex subunit 4-like [Penaeus indicus]|uniref:THO complex subunit 4-like n=1 Tax=Penaeus indicus TaxID=29960 RepID=UPI00300CFC3B
MTAKVDMSLEDIIKANKIKPGNRRGGTRGARGGRGRGGGLRRGGAAGGGGGGGGGGGQTRGRASGGRPFVGSRAGFAQRGNVEGRWNHDMYQGGGGGGGGGGRIQQSGPAKLLISNLDFGVSDSDIHELFTEFGTIRSAAVHYDRSGRSLGTAHVSFERHADAIKALKQYNGVQLDGRPMNITMDGGASAVRNTAPVKRLAQGPRPISGASYGGRGGRGIRGSNRRGNTRGSTRGGGRGRGGMGGRGGRNQVVPTAEELDAELDAYVNQVNK